MSDVDDRPPEVRLPPWKRGRPDPYIRIDDTRPSPLHLWAAGKLNIEDYIPRYDEEGRRIPRGPSRSWDLTRALARAARRLVRILRHRRA